MINKFIAGAVVSAFALSALPANAAGWGDKIQACAEAAQTEGLAAVADYDLKFVSGSSRRVTIEMAPADGGEPVVAQCKIARGKIKEVQLQA
ncbi:MAG: hypothetical protein ACX939_11525 [Hyphococcus sp.]